MLYIIDGLYASAAQTSFRLTPVCKWRARPSTQLDFPASLPRRTAWLSTRWRLDFLSSEPSLKDHSSPAA